MIFRKWGGGSKAVWNFSENSSVLEWGCFPQTVFKSLYRFLIVKPLIDSHSLGRSDWQSFEVIFLAKLTHPNNSYLSNTTNWNQKEFFRKFILADKLYFPLDWFHFGWKCISCILFNVRAILNPPPFIALAGAGHRSGTRSGGSVFHQNKAG